MPCSSRRDVNGLGVPTRFDWLKLQQFIQRLFMAAGVPEHNAFIVAESLVQANLRGVDSHGVVRTPIYLARIKRKMVDPNAEIAVVRESESTALVDGGNNFGAVVGVHATRLALEKAGKAGAAFVGVKRSNHFGTGAYYALKAIERNMVLMIMSNASQTMPPTGGVRPFIGTNPLAVGVPAGKAVPFLLDMATSVVARGKIIVAAQKGQPIPLGWAVDKHGNPTTDAEAALEGAVLPVGGAKGYGISLMIDILCGVLTGAGFGKYVNNMYENWEEPQNVGHVFIAVDISRFMPLELFEARMEQYIREIKQEPKAPGVEEILIPGEIEHRRTLELKREGIVLPGKLAEELDAIGREYGLCLADAAF